jgi:DNA mismatch repair protein MutS
VTFLRTVREGATDRSYGIHVADLAGVPEPVVDRSRTVLKKLREEKAIEARGGGDGGEPVQTVFDVGSGEFRSASGGGETAPTGPADAADAAATADGGAVDPESVLADEYGDSAPDVLDAVADLDVNETPPVELMAKVQEWQSRLDEE